MYNKKKWEGLEVIREFTGDSVQSSELKVRDVERLGEVRFFGGQSVFDFRALDDLRFDLSCDLNIRLDFFVHLISQAVYERSDIIWLKIETLTEMEASTEIGDGG